MAEKGICSICLDLAYMSYEHVPPRRVFNDKPAVAHTIYGLHEGNKYGKQPSLLKRSQGLGHRSLCERCNGQTGDWYGPAFADWTTQCLTYANRIRGDNNVLLPFHIKPLNVIKQIVVMALAISGSKSGGSRSDGLRHFVLSKQSMALPHDFFVRTYFNPTDPARAGKALLTQNRLTESCAVLDARSGASAFVLAEIAFPPMGYVVYAAVSGQKLSTDFTGLCDLRAFADSYYGQDATLFLNVPVRYPFGPVPGYYPDLNNKSIPYVDENHVLLTSDGRKPGG